MFDAEEDARSRSLRQCTVRRFSFADWAHQMSEFESCLRCGLRFARKKAMFFQRAPCVDPVTLFQMYFNFEPFASIL